jgi:DNA-binding transcriptional LysR family regulator
MHGSFTAAAGALHLSQPAVSQHISTLERELGTRLVVRSVTGARLTAEGEVALRHALRILQAADAARREIEGLRSGAYAPLRVAAFSTACTYVLPAAASAFRRRHPWVPFEFVDCDAEEALQRVRHADADVAITFDYAAHPLDAEGLTARHLADDPVRIALPERHPAARSAVVDLCELADEPWVSGTGFGCRESLRTVCGAAGFAPRVALDSNRYPTTLALVGAGHGIALVPDSALSHPPPGVVTCLLRPAAPPRRVWAMTTFEPTGPLTDFIDAVAAQLHGEATAPG